MPWGKMDDKFHRHQKVRALRRDKAGREALGVWVFWWSWCLDDSELTGFVPRDELSASDLKAAEVLVRVELWDKVEGGFQFHNFEKWNPKREQVEAKREADRRRIAGKRGGSRENVARDIARDIDASRTRHDGDVASDTDASRENVARESHPRASPSPSPSHPSPTQPLVVDSSFSVRVMEAVVSETRGTVWSVPTQRMHLRQRANEVAEEIRDMAAKLDLDCKYLCAEAFKRWVQVREKRNQDTAPHWWLEDWAGALPPPPKPKEVWRDLEG
jgi:hypothetical protein